MQIGCLFPPTASTPEHIAIAEELGYGRAFVYDSPAFLADPWITLGLAAARTHAIKIGVCASTPKLRHVVATAGALATLHAYAPGRTEAVIGSGFTSQLMLGQGPARWAEVEAYTRALRALLHGEEIEWDGARTGLKHGPRSGIRLPADMPLYIAAHGPRGYRVAASAGDGIVTNVSHRGDNPPPADLSSVQVLYYGSVLEPGEGYDSVRLLDAAGPYAAFQLHLGDGGVAGDAAARAEFDQRAGAIDPRRRHLEVHRGHLIELTGLERPLITGDLIRRTTGTGTPDEVRGRLAEFRASGVRGVLYGPMGDDIPRELEAFAAAATTTRSG